MNYINIPDDDDKLLSECKVETFRSGGKGGQHANKTDSAVRLTHLKSGIKAICEKERSQYLNKIKCLKILRKKILKINYKPPKRLKTKPTFASVKKRLNTKKINSDKKKNRRKLKLNDYDN